MEIAGRWKFRNRYDYYHLHRPGRRVQPEIGCVHLKSEDFFGVEKTDCQICYHPGCFLGNPGDYKIVGETLPSKNITKEIKFLPT